MMFRFRNVARRDERGFTLIELMVAMAVIGVLSVVIYRLFDVTSQNFREVDQLASLNERVRFGTERVRVLIQGASSQSTPDSDRDPYVRPELANARVMGLVRYNGWQNDRDALPADVAGENPNVSHDGLVLIGAYDFGVSFEMMGLRDADTTGFLYANDRSLNKLIHQNPFTYQATAFDSGDIMSLASALEPNMTTRLVRLLDGQGFMQFVTPLGVTGNTADMRVEIALPAAGTTGGPKFRDSTSMEGLDRLPEGDTGYDAAFIDAYWLHVVPSASNPMIMNLVLDRLCASGLVTALAPSGALDTLDPSSHLADSAPCNGALTRVVLASNVADFQVWFDCPTEDDGGLKGVDWRGNWVVDDTDECLNDDRSPRVGHVRLALHTNLERPDQRHIQFEDADGNTCGAGLACEPFEGNATLRTYDVMPDVTGAAQVVVMQSDFEIVNFSARNIQ